MSDTGKEAPDSKTKQRRGYCSVDAIDPHDGAVWQLLLSHDKMNWVGKQGKGQAMELAYTVRWALRHPRAIFRGVRELDKEIDEDEWLCYVATPNKAYDYKTGAEVPGWRDEVFLVFVTDERVIYNWYWSERHPCDQNLPINHEDRFAKRVL